MQENGAYPVVGPQVLENNDSAGDTGGNPRVLVGGCYSMKDPPSQRSTWRAARKGARGDGGETERVHRSAVHVRLQVCSLRGMAM
jgi:hypothetical protein